MFHVSLDLPSRRSRHAFSVLTLLCATSALSCRNLDSFDSKPGEAYCGNIGHVSLFHDGFIKEDSPPTLQLALRLDMSRLTSEPGRLNSNDPQGMCGTPDAPQVLFSNALLRAIPQVENDALSALSFGEGHDHDFFAWVDSSCQGTMLAVVSLMKNNHVELRLFKPARFPAPDATAAERPGFALFHLDPKPLGRSEKEGGCGFPSPP